MEILFEETIYEAYLANDIVTIEVAVKQNEVHMYGTWKAIVKTCARARRLDLLGQLSKHNDIKRLFAKRVDKIMKNKTIQETIELCQQGWLTPEATMRKLCNKTYLKNRYYDPNHVINMMKTCGIWIPMLDRPYRMYYTVLNRLQDCKHARGRTWFAHKCGRLQETLEQYAKIGGDAACGILHVLKKYARQEGYSQIFLKLGMCKVRPKHVNWSNVDWIKKKYPMVYVKWCIARAVYDDNPEIIKELTNDELAEIDKWFYRKYIGPNLLKYLSDNCEWLRPLCIAYANPFAATRGTLTHDVEGVVSLLIMHEHFAQAAYCMQKYDIHLDEYFVVKNYVKEKDIVKLLTKPECLKEMIKLRLIHGFCALDYLINTSSDSLIKWIIENCALSHDDDKLKIIKNMKF